MDMLQSFVDDSHLMDAEQLEQSEVEVMDIEGLKSFPVVDVVFEDQRGVSSS